MEDKAALRKYMSERQLIDIVKDHPGTLTAQQLVDALRPLTPRLYSIASSQADVEEEVHLTVAHVDYEAFGSRHQGGGVNLEFEGVIARMRLSAFSVAFKKKITHARRGFSLQ